MCDIFDKKCHISIVWDLESNLHLIRSLKLTNIFESQSFVFVNFLEFRFFNFMCFAPPPPPAKNYAEKSLLSKVGLRLSATWTLLFTSLSLHP